LFIDSSFERQYNPFQLQKQELYQKRTKMRKKLIFKLLLVIIVVFCTWVYFWNKPAPEKNVVVDLNNAILQN